MFFISHVTVEPELVSHSLNLTENIINRCYRNPAYKHVMTPMFYSICMTLYCSEGSTVLKTTYIKAAEQKSLSQLPTIALPSSACRQHLIYDLLHIPRRPRQTRCISEMHFLIPLTALYLPILIVNFLWKGAVVSVNNTENDCLLWCNSVLFRINLQPPSSE
jgi:hypothetical protein